MFIEAGKTLLIDEGAYEDRTTHGPFIVLKGFDQKQAVDQFVATETTKHPSDDPDWWQYGMCDAFLTWLAEQGFIRLDEAAIGWSIGYYDLTPEIDGKAYDPFKDRRPA